MDLIRRNVWSKLLKEDEESLLYLLEIEFNSLGYDRFFNEVGKFTEYIEGTELETKFNEILEKVNE